MNWSLDRLSQLKSACFEGRFVLTEVFNTFLSVACIKYVNEFATGKPHLSMVMSVRSNTYVFDV
jgi:hypothetical protein